MSAFEALPRIVRPSDRALSRAFWFGASVAIALGLGSSFRTDRGLQLCLVAFALAIAVVVMSRAWAGPLALLPALLVPSLPSIGPITPDLGAGLLAAGLLGLHVVATRPKLHPSRSVTTFVLVLGLVTMVLTVAGQTNAREAGFLWLASIVGVVSACLLVERPGAVRCLAWIGMGMAALAVYETIIGDHIWPLYRVGERYLLADDPSARRAFSTLGHPLIAGGALAVLAIIVAAAARGRTQLGFAGAIAAGSLCTVSRSAVLALVVALIFVIAFYRGRRARAMFTALGMAGVAAIMIYKLPVLSTAFSSRVLNSSEAQSVRDYSLDAARHAALSDPWGTAIGGGVGHGYELLVARGGNQGLFTYDNEYVTLFFDIGWLAMLSFAAWAAYLVVINASRQTVIGMAAALAAIVIAAFTDVLVWPSMTLLSWIAFGLATTRRAPDGSVS